VVREWQSISELTTATRIPANTIRRYCSTFSQYINSERSGKRVQYHPDTAELLLQIYAGYRAGLSTADIDLKLQQTGSKVMAMEPQPVVNQAAVLDHIGAALSIIAQQQQRLDAQDERIAHLEKRLDSVSNPWWKQLKNLLKKSE